MELTTYVKWADAKEACGPSDVVAGTLLKDGTPVYFVADVGVPDSEVRSHAFWVREGRPIGDGEKSLIALTELLEKHDA